MMRSSPWASSHYAKLVKFSKLQPTWTSSPGFERAMLNALAKRWPLDYSPDGD